MFIGFLLAVTIIVTGLSSAYIAAREQNKVIERKTSEIEGKVSAIVREFITNPDEHTPSKLAVMFDLFGATIAKGMVHEAAVQEKAEQSHVARVANNMLAEEQAYQNPILGILGKNKRGKNAAYVRLAEMIGQQLGAAGGGGNGAGGGGATPPVRRHRE